MVRLGKWKIDLPEYFVARYFDEFVAWAKQIPQGVFKPTRLFVFNEGELAEWSPDPEQGKQMLGAWLFARISSKAIECEPFNDSDRTAIERHCRRMIAARVNPRDRLIEPERPGIPVIPWRH
jgi:hypothetical protein